MNFWPRTNRYIPVSLNPKQAAFLLLANMEAFYGGAAGGGKSVALLAGALQYADLPGYSALITRKSYTSLEQPGGLIDVSKTWLGGTDAVWKESEHTWYFPSGSTLTFRHFQEEMHFQSGEYQYIGVDEVTELELSEYLFLFGRLRKKAGSPVPTRMRCASNPYGPGREWVKQRFVINGRASKRPYVPARLEDNPHLDADSYEASLAELPFVMRQQFRYGDWEVAPEGGLFKAEWFEGQMIEQSRVPEGLSVCRFWDLAATEPKKGTDPDYTVGLLLGQLKGIFYLLDVIRVRLSSFKVQELVLKTAASDRERARMRNWRTPIIRMEKEPGGSGTALIDHYRRDVLAGYDFRGVGTSGDKATRAVPVANRAEAGELLIARGPWNGAFIEEVCAFPFAAHDDQVDALSGAYLALAESGGRQHTRVSTAIISRKPPPRPPRGAYYGQGTLKDVLSFGNRR